MSKLVYCAGPYSLPDPVENIHNACKVADGVLALGYIPVVPHLTGLWHLVSPKPYGVWLAIDLEILAKCDYCYRYGGDSVGADREVEFCQKRGIPVVYDLNKLPKVRGKKLG